MRVLSIRVAAGVALLTAVSACAGTANKASSVGTDQTGGTITVGVLGPLTGANAADGIGVEGGASIAAAEINAAGGVKVDGKTYKIKIVAYDDQFTPTGAVAAVDRMISQNDIKYILGPTTGTNVAAIEPIVQSNQVINLEGGFGSTVVSPKYSYSYRALMTPLEYCRGWYDWIAANRPTLKRVAIVAPDNVVGQGSVTFCVSAATEAGLQAKGFYNDPDSQDYSSIVAQILASSPNAVDLTGEGPGPSAGMTKQLIQDGFRGQIMKSSASTIGTITQVAGAAAAKDQLYFAQVNDTTPQAVAVIDKYHSEYGANGEGGESLALIFHDALYLLVDAMEKAQSINPSALKSVLQDYSYTLPLMGKVTFGGLKTYGIKNELISDGYIEEWTGSSSKVLGEIPASSP